MDDIPKTFTLKVPGTMTKDEFCALIESDSFKIIFMQELFYQLSIVIEEEDIYPQTPHPPVGFLKLKQK